MYSKKNYFISTIIWMKKRSLKFDSKSPHIKLTQIIQTNQFLRTLIEHAQKMITWSGVKYAEKYLSVQLDETFAGLTSCRSNGSSRDCVLIIEKSSTRNCIIIVINAHSIKIKELWGNIGEGFEFPHKTSRMWSLRDVKTYRAGVV